MNTPTITEEDISTLRTFTEIYPTWWYKIGMCTVTRDFDCAPQAGSPEIEFIELGLWPDDAFRCDHPGSLADAIRDVMNQISDARLAVHLSRSQP